MLCACARVGAAGKYELDYVRPAARGAVDVYHALARVHYVRYLPVAQCYLDAPKGSSVCALHMRILLRMLASRPLYTIARRHYLRGGRSFFALCVANFASICYYMYAVNFAIFVER